jgi:hypothetical protein
MSASLEYRRCPFCNEVRNLSGMTAHMRKKHRAVKEVV